MTNSQPVGEAPMTWMYRFAKSPKVGAIDMLCAFLDANVTIFFFQRVAPYYLGGRDHLWTSGDRLASAAEGHIDVINIGEPHGTNT